jgi:hypothetical protein
MRIGIDARFYGSLGKGLGRYTQKLIENLEKIDNINQYFIFLRKENFDEYQPRNKSFQKVLADYRWYTFSEQINMPRILNRCNLDLVHFPHFNVPLFYKKPFIITIHDLILLHFPTIKSTTLNPVWYKIKFLAYKLVINSAIKRAKKIISVSNFTRNDILKNYNIPENKVAVTYEAADLSLTIFLKKFNNNNTLSSKVVRDEEILKKYDIIKPYILYVGNAYPHKNLEALVLGFGEIKDAIVRGSTLDNALTSQKVEPLELFGVSLVLVGKEDYFYKKIKKLAKEKEVENIIFTGFVPDDELDIIYKNSLFYIFPSLYEGFGLPPIEAMTRSVPILSSDIPCLREVLGENAYYFDARKKESFSKAIIDFSENKELREKLARSGSEWVKKYSWGKMSEETLRIYKN